MLAVCSVSLLIPKLCEVSMLTGLGKGEDALANLSIECLEDGTLQGHVRIRSKTQGIALSLGDKSKPMSSQRAIFEKLSRLCLKLLWHRRPLRHERIRFHQNSMSVVCSCSFAIQVSMHARSTFAGWRAGWNVTNGVH